MIEHTKVIYGMNFDELETSINMWETINNDKLHTCHLIKFNHSYSPIKWLFDTNYQAIIGYTLKKGYDDLDLF